MNHTSDFHSELWSVVRPRRDILDLAQREHAVDDLSKDDVLPVKEIARCGRDEKLYKSVALRRNTRGDGERRWGTWQPFVLGPELAYLAMSKTHNKERVWLFFVLTIDRSPGPVCFTWKFSS